MNSMNRDLQSVTDPAQNRRTRRSSFTGFAANGAGSRNAERIARIGDEIAWLATGE